MSGKDKAETFIDRLAKEGTDLSKKVEKLSDFLDSDKFKELDKNQQMLLTIQLGSMSAYLTAITMRLHLLSEQEATKERPDLSGVDSKDDENPQQCCGDATELTPKE